MRYLLDTSVCIAFLNGNDTGVRDRLLSIQPKDVALCSIVKAELVYGARHSKKVEENLQRLDRFFEPFHSLPFDDATADQYGLIRAQLRREGSPIGANDMMIAAIAVYAELTLVTRNQSEFRRVAGLRVEAW